MERSEMIDELARRQVERKMDEAPIRTIVEYLARRLDLDDGEQDIAFHLTNGRLRESNYARRRIRNTALEFLGRR